LRPCLLSSSFFMPSTRPRLSSYPLSISPLFILPSIHPRPHQPESFAVQFLPESSLSTISLTLSRNASSYARLLYIPRFIFDLDLARAGFGSSRIGIKSSPYTRVSKPSTNNVDLAKILSRVRGEFLLVATLPLSIVQNPKLELKRGG
jgi:hypothetical protein